MKSPAAPSPSSASMHDDVSLAAAKKALRLEVRTRLRALGPVPAAGSAKAVEQLIQSGLLDGAACVALFRALPSEPDLTSLEPLLHARGARVCFPLVHPGQRELTFHLAGGALERGPLGIEQPSIERERIDESQIDVFVVPALALDLHGNRLGHGRAHYDATLVGAPRALRIGLVREAALVPAVPVGEHDAPLDALCTEARFIFLTERAKAAAAKR